MTKQNHNDLFGLVLVGGRSRRMGQDKGRLIYYSQPQVQHCFYLLENICSQTYVSVSKDQSALPVYQGLPNMLDDSNEEESGPLRGILTALRRHPSGSWLVLACDLPFVDRPILQDLVLRRNPQRMATAFYNPQTESPEPMCAIYEPSIVPLMEKAVQNGVFCPRKILVASAVEVLTIDRPKALQNVNTLEDYYQTRRHLHQKRADI